MAIIFGVKSKHQDVECQLWFDRHDDGAYGLSLTGDFREAPNQIDFDDMTSEDVEEFIAFLRVKKPINNLR